MTVYRTKTGRILTEADIEALADEAERGYVAELAVAIARENPHVAVSQQEFYEDMIDKGWFSVTPDGVESTPEYERFNDGSPAT